MSNPVSIAEIRTVSAQYRAKVADAVRYVGCHPEVGFKEKTAAALQESLLDSCGFEVKKAGRLETAFRADLTAVPGSCQLKAAILTEYDALAAPLGHACGHQLIMGAGLLALLVTADLMKKYSIPGILCAIGCPGEEQLGGKVYMLEDGIFDDVNIALLSHPFFRSGVTKRLLAAGHFEVDFFGCSSHASTAPEQGINALDAMTLFMSGINAWRQQLPDSARVHGIVTNGGSAANVIPDHTSGIFYVRSEEKSMQEKLEKRFEDIAHGAALMTGCQYKVYKQPASYGSGKPHAALVSAAEEIFRSMNIEPDENIRDPFTTDFANVCEKLPGVNIFFDITNGRPVPLHSSEFRALAADDNALNAMESAAVIMAKLTLDYFIDKNFQHAINSR